MDRIKRYITNPPVLAPYDSKKSILLYVSETISTIGAILAQKDDNNKERAIYYISKTFLNYEIKYTLIKRCVL